MTRESGNPYHEGRSFTAGVGVFDRDALACSLKLFSERKIKALVNRTYPLPEARQALADLLAAKVVGKLVLTP